jgi:type 1 glutamine amidotransferase
MKQRAGRSRIHPCVFLLFCLASSLAAARSQPAPPATRPPAAAQDPYAGKKKVLAIADVHTGYQHDSISHALATIERLGRESGLYVTFIRTDTQLITKDKIFGTGKYAAPPAGQRGVNARNLDYFDAIFFLGLGEEDLSEQQKKDLLSFVHDDGKGFVGGHSAIDAFYHWPEYGEMVGAYFDNHPWGVFDAPIVVEEPLFPGLAGLPREFSLRDEIYVVTDSPYSRDKVDVLMRLDASGLNLKIPGLNRSDGDFPVAWVKNYGKGRVFYSTLGHSDESWDDTRVQKMYFEAIKWALGLTPYTVAPHPLPARK